MTTPSGLVAAAIGVRLRSPLAAGLLAASGDSLRLSWSVTGADASLTQLGYEVEASPEPSFPGGAWTSGPVSSPDQVGVPAPGPAMRSREVRYLRARVSTEAGWSAWSEVLRIEAGLLEPADWVARPVTLPDDPGSTRQAPPPLLRRPFALDSPPVAARLYVTALGLHLVTINGQPVSDDLLAPGWTAYRHRLVADSYDVTALLGQGENVIGAALGDGWWRGRLGFNPGVDRCTYGPEVALIAQLELRFADGSSTVIATDEAWRASTGEIRSADLYDGCSIDLRERRPGWDAPGYDAGDWTPVRVLDVDLQPIEPRLAPPVRVIGVLPVDPVPRGPGRTLLDGGQNIAGWVRLTVRGSRGTAVTVRHAEVLEPDGSLHVLALRSARATDTWVLADDGVVTLEPAFTFHGFQFAEVETDAEILGAELVAISSDAPTRSSFESGDRRLNRLHENVAWSQRDNFVSVPTDCPQRDERLGWTGDAQAFVATGSTLLDAEAFWRSWLRDLALEQDPVLGVPSVVPDVVLRGPMRFGRSGWADAAAIVPWSVYEAYGDAGVIEAQWPSIRMWVDSLAARRGDDGLLVPSDQFGDWLDPDAPASRPWEAKVDSELLANAFFAHSARLAARAARLLGDEPSGDRYDALAEDVARRTWERWRDQAIRTQSGAAAAIALGVAPPGERPRVGAALAALVREARGSVATGFLGTPLVLPALSQTGFIDECYLMLLRRDPPSWLYQVDRGATTVWERWDAILPDGSIHPGTMTPLPGEDGEDGREDGHMLSFNHYAYGAVIDWVYRNVAGVSPTLDAPGYREVVVAPRPSRSIGWARASVETSFGPIRIDWRLQGDEELAIDVELPFGVRGLLRAPVTEASEVRIDGASSNAEATLGPGRHAIVVTHPRTSP